jgi:hypothetical protein
MTVLHTLGLVACGGGARPRRATRAEPAGHRVEEGTIHLFNKKCRAAPVNQALTIEFENHDMSLEG